MKSYFQHVQSGTKNIISKYYLVILPFLVPIFWWLFNHSNYLNSNLLSNELLEQNEVPDLKDCFKNLCNYPKNDSVKLYSEMLSCLLETTFASKDGFHIALNTSYDTSYLLVDFSLPNLFKFNKYEYRLPSDYIASIEYQDAKQIIQKVRDINIRFDKLQASLLWNKQRFEKHECGKSLNVKLDIGVIINFIEKWINKFQNKKTSILIKGYTDGSVKKYWFRNLIPNFIDEYKSIDYYPMPDSYKNAEFEYHLYKDDLKEHCLDCNSNRYKNSDLPFLRAKYISEEIIKPQLKMYDIDDIDIKILQGKVIERAIQKPQLRFVDVFIKFEL